MKVKDKMMTSRWVKKIMDQEKKEHKKERKGKLMWKEC